MTLRSRAAENRTLELGWMDRRRADAAPHGGIVLRPGRRIPDGVTLRSRAAENRTLELGWRDGQTAG